MSHPPSKLLALSILAALHQFGCSVASAGDEEAIENLGVSEEELCFEPRGAGDVIRGVDAEQARAFRRGKATFVKEFTAAEGLGPVLNEKSCRNCHDGGSTRAVGGFGTVTVTRFGRSQDGAFDGLARLGGTLIQAKGIGAVGECNYSGESVPAEANVVARRLTQPLFGLGLVDALAASSLHALAASQPVSVRGRVAEITDSSGAVSVGKFGWKANVTSLANFAAGALNGEMGITTPASPNETCPQGDCALLRCNPRPDINDDGTSAKNIEVFMKLLAPPQARNLGPRAARGERTFKDLGCADCHTPTLKSGPSEIAALSEKAFRPYSDFLLHDMGSLGDGVPQGAARAREMRTAPLWGLGDRTRFLHDGRAETVEEAILAHDGQGRAAALAFGALDYGQKYRLMLFLKSL